MMSTAKAQPSESDIVEAHQRIAPHIVRTPVLANQRITQLAGCEYLGLKAEHLQLAGSFKERGVTNRMLTLPPHVKNLVTCSSGNHAIALTKVAVSLNLKPYVYMPTCCSRVKVNKVKEAGGTVIQNHLETRAQILEFLEILSVEKDATIVSSAYEPTIIAGQASVSKQIYEDVQNLDYVVVPLGSGSLAVGSLFSTKYFGKNCKLVMVQPELAGQAKRSLETGQICQQISFDTIADGLRFPAHPNNIKTLMSMCSPDDLILVSQESIVEAMKIIYRQMKLMIEPSAAATVAAVLKDPRFRNKRVTCVLSGGNIDNEMFSQLTGIEGLSPHQKVEEVEESSEDESAD